MPNRRNYNFLGSFDKYRGYIITAVASFVLGGAIFSNCRGPGITQEKPEPPYPVTSQIYKIDGVNNGYPVMRTKMSDFREEEISFADSAEGKNFTSVRKLEKQDVDGTREKWSGIKRDITSKMREADVMKSK